MNTCPCCKKSTQDVGILDYPIWQEDGSVWVCAYCGDDFDDRLNVERRKAMDRVMEEFMERIRKDA